MIHFGNEKAPRLNPQMFNLLSGPYLAAAIEMTQHNLHVQEKSRRAAAEKLSNTFGISRW